MNEDSENKNMPKILTASIDYVAIDTESGVTVSGTTNLPETLYKKPIKERDLSASQLLIQRNEKIKEVESLVTEVVHNVLETPNSSAQGKEGNLFIFLNSNFYGSSVGGDVHEVNITLIQEWNQIKNEINTKQLLTEFEKVIQRVQEQAKEDQHRTDLANITLARDELNKADGPAMLKYLRKVGGFGLDIIKAVGSEILIKLITGGI